MATKEKIAVEEDEITIIDDELTTITPKKESGYKGPMVDVFLPALEDSGSNGLKVDQYEHVTIANEEKEEHWKIHRGEHVEVPVPVFCVLKERYGKSI